MRNVEVQKVERVLEDRFSVDRATVRYERPDGSMSELTDRLCMERGDAAAVLVYDRGAGELLLVRQFRYATLRHGEPFLLEIVAGSIDPGESPEEAARRETREETGYRVRDLRLAAQYYSSPGGVSEKLHIYYGEVGKDDQVSAGGGEEGEDVEIVRLSAAEAFRRMDEGEIKDGKTLVALLWMRANVTL